MRWRYQETVLTLCTVAFFVTMVGRLAISPIIPDISADLDISNAMIGGALTAMWVAYALVQFPSGVLADRFGERVVILASVVGTGLTTLLIGGRAGVRALRPGTVLLGVGRGTPLQRRHGAHHAHVRRHRDGDRAPQRRRTGRGPGDAHRRRLGRRVVRLAGGHRSHRSPRSGRRRPLLGDPADCTERRPDQPMGERFDLGPMVSLLSRPTIAFTSVVAVPLRFHLAGAGVVPADFLRPAPRLLPDDGRNAVRGYFVAHGILQIGVGGVADRFGRDLATALCMVSGIAGLVAIIFGTGLPAIVAGIELLGLGMGWSAAVFPRFLDNLSAAEQSSGFGLIRTAYMVVAAAGSVVVGVFADAFGWGVSFGFLAVLLAVALSLFAANRAFALGY